MSQFSDPTVIDIDRVFAEAGRPTPGTGLAVKMPETAFGRALEGANLPALENPEFDLQHKGDQAIALAHSAVNDHEGLVIDLLIFAGTLSDRFAIAPVRFSGEKITRRRDVSDGECEFSCGGTRMFRAAHQRTRGPWSMHFEPGAILRGQGSGSSWRASTAIVPPIPSRHRPETEQGHFIVWEQEWTERILRPRDPALIEHVVGDVYMVKAVWDLTALEAAALRGKR